MMPMSEKLAEAHRDDLLREAEQQRLVAQVFELESIWHTIAARWASFLRARGFRMFSMRPFQARADALRINDHYDDWLFSPISEPALVRTRLPQSSSPSLA